MFRWEKEHFFDESWVCMGRADGFDKTGHHLVAQRFAECKDGFSPTPAVTPRRSKEHAGNLAGLIRNYGYGELVVGARHDYEITANWKILAENYYECYHCSSIHPELCEVSPPSSGGDNMEPEGAWIRGPWTSTRASRPCPSTARATRSCSRT